jgi:hypothetical protein
VKLFVGMLVVLLVVIALLIPGLAPRKRSTPDCAGRGLYAQDPAGKWVQCVCDKAALSTCRRLEP